MYFNFQRCNAEVCHAGFNGDIKICVSQIIAISFSSDKPSLRTVIHLTIKSTITVCFPVKDSDGAPVRVQAVVKRNREQDGYFLISSVCSCIVEIVGEDSNRSSRCAASLREQSAATFRRPKFCWQRDLAESANKMQTSEEKEKYELIFLFQQDPNSHNESGGWVCLEKETWTGLLLLRWQHHVSVQKKFTARLIPSVTFISEVSGDVQAASQSQ